jgi:hypothetical protein
MTNQTFETGSADLRNETAAVSETNSTRRETAATKALSPQDDAEQSPERSAKPAAPMAGTIEGILQSRGTENREESSDHPPDIGIATNQVSEDAGEKSTRGPAPTSDNLIGAASSEPPAKLEAFEDLVRFDEDPWNEAVDGPRGGTLGEEEILSNALTIFSSTPALIAGEDPSELLELSNALIKEQRPQSLLEIFAHDQVIDSELTLKRMRLARKWQWSAAIAKSLHVQLVNREAVVLLVRERESGIGRTRQQDDIEHSFRQEWWRSTTSRAFAAVSGDKEAIRYFESKLGLGAIALNPFVDFDDIMRRESMAERISTSAIAARNSAWKIMLKCEGKRQRKSARKEKLAENSKSLEARNADPGSTDREPLQRDTTTVHAPKPDHGKVRK